MTSCSSSDPYPKCDKFRHDSHIYLLTFRLVQEDGNGGYAQQHPGRILPIFRMGATTVPVPMGKKPIRLPWETDGNLPDGRNLLQIRERIPREVVVLLTLEEVTAQEAALFQY